MNAIAFDTLGIARDLEAAGVGRQQAEAHAHALRKATAGSLEHLATKADLALLATKADLAPLATKADLALLATSAGLAALETRLTQRLYAVVFAAVVANGLIAGSLVTAMKLL